MPAHVNCNEKRQKLSAAIFSTSLKRVQ